MLDHVGGVTDDTGNQDLPGAEFSILPDLPFMLVARVGTLDDISADFHLQDQVDNVLERNIAGVRARQLPQHTCDRPANLRLHE